MNHGMRDDDLGVLPVSPALDLRTLHAPAFVHCVVEAAQQRLIVVGEPAGRPRANQLLQNRRRHLRIVSGCGLGGALNDRTAQMLIGERHDQRRRLARFHLAVPAAQERDRALE